MRDRESLKHCLACRKLQVSTAGPRPALCPEPALPPRQVEAIEYYTKLEQKLKEEYKREKEKVNEKPLGMAFVTFHNETITAM